MKSISLYINIEYHCTVRSFQNEVVHIIIAISGSLLVTLHCTRPRPRVIDLVSKLRAIHKLVYAYDAKVSIKSKSSSSYSLVCNLTLFVLLI